VSPTIEKKMEKIPVSGLNASKKLKTAVLVDVDGTLAGPYKNKNRQLRPTALSAIKMLSEHAPVFLWSIVGADNGERLISEFAELGDYVTGCYGKDDFLLHLVEHPYCIDDEAVDPQILCNHVIVDTYNGGPDSGHLLKAAQIIAMRLSEMVNSHIQNR
jgi:hypothetical protein